MLTKKLDLLKHKELKTKDDGKPKPSRTPAKEEPKKDIDVSFIPGLEETGG